MQEIKETSIPQAWVERLEQHLDSAGINVSSIDYGFIKAMYDSRFTPLKLLGK